jgi:hypothetical protein
MTSTSAIALMGLPENGDDDVSTVSPISAPNWFELIDEKTAAEFLDLKPRTLQDWRQRSSQGPPFVRISGRCVKYRRIDLRRWSEERLRKSTSDIAAGAE